MRKRGGNRPRVLWGLNSEGQIGDGTRTDRLVPTVVGGGRIAFSQVDAADLTCGIELETGIAYCWGKGSTVPTPVGAGTIQFRSLMTAYDFACGVEVQTGFGYCWNHTLVPNPVPAPLASRPVTLSQGQK